MMRRYREAEVKPEAPIMDPVAAADVNPLKRTRRRAHPRRADRQGNHRRPQAPSVPSPALLQGRRH
ncbi:MAG: hypothetical protein ACLTSX_02220 [Collinsella sp.]